MKPGEIILKAGSKRKAEIIKKVEESGLSELLKEMNNERCRIAGINSPQKQPLPGIAEDIRAFFERTSIRVNKFFPRKNKGGTYQP